MVAMSISLIGWIISSVPIIKSATEAIAQKTTARKDTYRNFHSQYSIGFSILHSSASLLSGIIFFSILLLQIHGE